MKLVNKNHYFDLYRVTDHTYAGIATSEETYNNCGFIDLGSIVIIFDTFLSIEATKILKRLVYTYTNPKKLIVVNSHAHLDNFLGNIVFKNEAIFISSMKVMKKLNTLVNPHLGPSDEHKNKIEQLTEALLTETNEEKILDIKNELIFTKNFDHPEAELVLPQFIIKHELTITSIDHFFDLHAIDNAHSIEDIYGRYPDEKVLYAGDLVFVDEHPLIAEGDPINLINILEDFYHMDVDYIIPGHGRICTKQDLLDQIGYIKAMLRMVNQNLEHPEKIKVNDLDVKYQRMKSFAFRRNVNALVTYLQD